ARPRRSRCRRARTAPAACTPPTSSAALELVDPAGEVVDETEQRVVHDPLLGEGGLDVPAHELAQRALDLEGDPALRSGAPFERLVGADGPEALRQPAHRRRVAGIAVDCPLQLLVDPVDVSRPVYRLRHAAAV